MALGLCFSALSESLLAAESQALPRIGFLGDGIVDLSSDESCPKHGCLWFFCLWTLSKFPSVNPKTDPWLQVWLQWSPCGVFRVGRAGRTIGLKMGWSYC